MKKFTKTVLYFFEENSLLKPINNSSGGTRCQDLSHQVLNLTRIFYEVYCTLMTETIEDTDIKEIKKENDRIIMKIFGLDYEKFFPQEHQYEK